MNHQMDAELISEIGREFYRPESPAIVESMDAETKTAVFRQ